MNRQTAEARIGTTVSGRWTLERLLGVGGMAAVYAARHKIGRVDAIKILHPEVASTPARIERFEREARAANLFRHPGAVEVRDTGVLDDGTPYLVMELVEGETLGERRRQGPMPAADVLRFADELLDVLAAAHERGIVHRDIKPDNLVVDASGHVRVLDFGIARLPGPRMTQTGTTMGTASYMAPEQVRGEGVDARSDLFAVGATMFRLLAGRAVHEAESDAELVFKMGTSPAPPLAETDPSQPPEICAVVDRALRFRKAERYPDARTMQGDVRAVRDGREPPYAAEQAAAGPAPEAGAPGVGSDDGGAPPESTLSIPELPLDVRLSRHESPAPPAPPGPDDEQPAPPTVRVPMRRARLRRIVLGAAAAPFVLVGLLLLGTQISLARAGRGNWVGWMLVGLVLTPGLVLAAAAWQVGPGAEALRAALRIARTRNGRITALDLATDTSLGVEEAEQVLAVLAQKGACRRLEEGGKKVYAFSELGG